MADDQMNILHISDIHALSDDANQRKVFRAFLNDVITTASTPLRPSLVVITGDLVKDGDDVSAYSAILDFLILPLLDELSLTTDDLIIVPGNHDARRSIIQANEAVQDEVLKCQTSADIDKIYEESKHEVYFVEKFANLSALQDALGNSNTVKSNPAFSIYHIKKLDLVILSLNSAWLTFGGLRGREKGQLRIADLAIQEAFEALPTAKTTMVLTHHPLSWLSDENENNIRRLRPNNSIHLFGHVHDAHPENSFTPNGNVLTCQSGALYTERAAYNGFAIVSVCPQRQNAKITYRTYFDKRGRFDVATDILANGTFYSSEESESYWASQPSQISSAAVENWIAATIAPAIRSNLLDGLTGRALNEIFVPPVFSLNAELSDDPSTGSGNGKELGWTDFVLSTENHLLRGRPEYGKTSVLRELNYELSSSIVARAHPKIPILIRFSDIPETLNKFSGVLRASIPECPSNSFSFSQLAEDGYLCILIDDIEFHDAKRISTLSAFMKQYPLNRFVMTTVFDQFDSLGRSKSAEFPVSTTEVFLRQFGRARIRKIVQNLNGGDRYQQEAILNRIMNDMKSMNVPWTAANGTMLLTVFQSEQSFVPVNRAIVLDRFIDIMLKRFSADETKRSTFDFKNKSHLLSKIARWMCEKETYAPDYSVLYDFVNSYLHQRALKYNAENIIAELISSRVLYRTANAIGFRYKSFLEYFVAREMEDDAAFRDWVFQEDRYLSFVYEIEYYSGLSRNDPSALQLIGERFLVLATSVRHQLGELGDLSLVDKLAAPTVGKGVDAYAVVHRQLKLPKISDEERDALLEADMPTEVPGQEVYRPKFSDDAQRWITCLLLYSRVLRNMELVGKNEKIGAMKILFHGWGELLVRTIQVIPSLVKHRYFIANGIRYSVIAPTGMSDDKLFRFLVLNGPRVVSQLIFENMGSEKLHGVIELDSDFINESLVEKLFRKVLYAD